MSKAHKNICREIKLQHFNKNEMIYKQGDYGDYFFYILSGSVKIVVSKDSLLNEIDFLNINDQENRVKYKIFILKIRKKLKN